MNVLARFSIPFGGERCGRVQAAGMRAAKLRPILRSLRPEQGKSKGSKEENGFHCDGKMPPRCRVVKVIQDGERGAVGRKDSRNNVRVSDLAGEEPRAEESACVEAKNLGSFFEVS